MADMNDVKADDLTLTTLYYTNTDGVECVRSVSLIPSGRIAAWQLQSVLTDLPKGVITVLEGKIGHVAVVPVRSHVPTPAEMSVLVLDSQWATEFVLRPCTYRVVVTCEQEPSSNCKNCESQLQEEIAQLRKELVEMRGRLEEAKAVLPEPQLRSPPAAMHQLQPRLPNSKEEHVHAAAPDYQAMLNAAVNVKTGSTVIKSMRACPACLAANVFSALEHTFGEGPTVKCRVQTCGQTYCLRCLQSAEACSRSRLNNPDVSCLLAEIQRWIV